MQEKVPQFLKEEGKIMGIFTFKQILVYAGGLFLAIFYYQIFNFFFFILFTLITFGIITAIYFIKINNQPFYKVLPDILAFFIFHRQGSWSPPKKKIKKEIVIPEIELNKKELKKDKDENKTFTSETKMPSTTNPTNPYRFLPRK